MNGPLSMLAVLAAASLSAVAAGCSGSGEDKAGGGGSQDDKPAVLTLAVHDPAYTASEFAAAVQRLSSGTIDVQIRGRWRVGDADYERGLVEDVQDGRADLGVVGARIWDRMGVTSFQPLLAPLLVDGLGLQRRLLRGVAAPRLVRSLDRAGVVGMAVLPGAPRRPFGVTRALLGPEDYAGATIGIRPGGVAEASFRSLGAIGVPWSGGSMAPVDGLELDLVSVADNFYDRRGRALTANVTLWPQVQTLFMNRAAFRALTPAQQGILRRAGREAVDAVIADIAHVEKVALAEVCERGRTSLVTASPADVTGLRKAARPLYAQLERDADTKPLMDEILELRGKDSPGASALRCSGGHVQTKASTIAGRWRYAPTRQGLLDAGMSPKEAEMLSVPVIFAFADGRFTISAGGAVAATGRYTEQGDAVNIVFETGPSLAAPGHVFELGWSVYRNRLTFSTVEGREALLYLIAGTLTRVR